LFSSQNGFRIRCINIGIVDEATARSSLRGILQKMARSYDCRRLLQYVVRAEADLSSFLSSIDDTHPPQLVAYATPELNDQHFLVLVSYTRHAMAAQLYRMESAEPWMESKEEEEEMDASRVGVDPVEIVLLRADHDSVDEAITCVSVVEPSSQLISSQSTRNITSTSSLIKGVMSFEEDTPAGPDTITFSTAGAPTPSLAIVFGTSLGNLYTVPVTIAKHRSSAQDYSLQRVPSPTGTSLCLVLSHPSLQEVEFTSRDILSLSTTTTLHSETTTETLLTIVYKNSTFVRIPTRACFPIREDDPPALVRHRARMRLPPGLAARVLPLPPTPTRPARSPLQDLALSASPNRAAGIPNEALVYYPEGGGGHSISSELVPTWAIYASVSSIETDHHASAFSSSPMTDLNPQDEPEEGDDDDDGILFVSVTKALVGSAVGAWRWGVRHKPPSEEKPSSSFALEPEWVDYTVSSMWHDAPRAIEQATVDPVQGNLIATTDSLGRIVLMERSTRQIIRMWKGFRDASCYWIQQKSSSGSSDLHLVIHSRQRRRIEVWQVRHGDRVLSLTVGRGAQVVPLCSVSGAPQCLWTVTPHRLEWIQIPSPDETPVEAPIRPMRALSQAASYSKQQSGALRLKHLQQLLSASSHLTLGDVRAALYEIQSLVDLSTALDFCATGSVLDDTLGVQGSSFHREVIAHCHSVLNIALRGDGNALDRTLPSRTNPMVVGLTQRLDYHEKVSGALRRHNSVRLGLISILSLFVFSW
jgi:Rab3 GTPase-activating protein regulatory subunit N-terminus